MSTIDLMARIRALTEDSDGLTRIDPSALPVDTAATVPVAQEPDAVLASSIWATVSTPGTDGGSGFDLDNPFIGLSGALAPYDPLNAAGNPSMGLDNDFLLASMVGPTFGLEGIDIMGDFLEALLGTQSSPAQTNVFGNIANNSGVAGRVAYYVQNQTDLRDTQGGSVREFDPNRREPEPNDNRGRHIVDIIADDGSTSDPVDDTVIKGSEKSDYVISRGDADYGYERSIRGGDYRRGDVTINDRDGLQGTVFREGLARNTTINSNGLTINQGASENRTAINGGAKDDVIFDELKGKETRITGGDGNDTYIADLEGSTFENLTIDEDVEQVYLMLPEDYELRDTEDSNTKELWVNGVKTDRTVSWDRSDQDIITVEAANEAGRAHVQGIIEDKGSEIARLRGDMPFNQPGEADRTTPGQAVRIDLNNAPAELAAAEANPARSSAEEGDGDVDTGKPADVAPEVAKESNEGIFGVLY